MKFNSIKSLLLEDNEIIELIFKDFTELLPHKPRLSIVEFSNDFKPRLKLTSQIDPSISGYVEYDEGIDVRKAYLSLVNGKDVIDFMKRHMNNEYTALSWYLMVKDIEETDQNMVTDHEKEAEDFTPEENETQEVQETPIAGQPEEISPESELESGIPKSPPANVKIETEPITI